MFMEVICWSLFDMLYLMSLRERERERERERGREMIALLLLSFGCLVAVNVLWLFLALP